MHFRIDTARLVYAFLAFFVLVFVPACSFFTGSGPAVMPVREGCVSPEEMPEAIERLAQRVASVQLRARVQIEVRGQRQPSVKCFLRMSLSETGDRIRVSGTGPLGISLFDALFSGDELYLYIPSHGALYVGNPASVLAFPEDISVARIAALALDPWLVAAENGAVEQECGDDAGYQEVDARVCFFSEKEKAYAVFDRADLAPLFIKSAFYSASFKESIDGTNLLPCVNYPREITVRARRAELVIRIRVYEIESGVYDEDNTVFDLRQFKRGRILPLDVLLRGA